MIFRSLLAVSISQSEQVKVKKISIEDKDEIEVVIVKLYMASTKKIISLLKPKYSNQKR
jgi:hypothetical protein